MDYILVMSLFTTAVVIHHYRVDRQHHAPGCFCCCFQFRNVDSCQSCAVTPRIVKLGGVGRAPTKDPLSLFFRHYFAPFVLRPRNKVCILLCLCTWVVFAAIEASQLTPATEMEQLLKADHPLQGAIKILSSKTRMASAPLKVYVVWGVGDIDRSDVDIMYNPNYIGKPTWDESFDFTEECQLALRRVCDELPLMDDALFVDHIKVSCFAHLSRESSRPECLFRATKMGTTKFHAS